MSDRIEARIRGYRAPDVFNPWGQCCVNDVSQYAVLTRWNNLQSHFDCPDARFLLIGEAPGYKGARYSGVPFTSEAQLIRGDVPRIPAIGRLTKRTTPMGEASATIVWRALKQLGIADRTVMWNSFPFHPHEPGRPLSNRAPRKSEVEATADILRMVVEHFPNAIRIAVGASAARALNNLCVSPHYTVRHPSNGGAREFAAGMLTILEGG